MLEMTFNDWRDEHRIVILNFLKYLNERTSNYILKSGTSLMTCYDLDRFSEDIDLDSNDKSQIKSIVDSFCKEYDFSYRIAKDTDTVKRFMIHYNDKSPKPLKVEISYREKHINYRNVNNINGINVYDIERIASMKISAYLSRDKIRDLYDVTFIINNYYERLSESVIQVMTDGLAYKNIDYFMYIVEQQSDELIDKNKLTDDFIDALDKLGLSDDKTHINERDADSKNSADEKHITGEPTPIRYVSAESLGRKEEDRKGNYKMSQMSRSSKSSDDYER